MIVVGSKVRIVKCSTGKACKQYIGRVGVVCNTGMGSDAISVRFGDRDNGDRAAFFPGEYEEVKSKGDESKMSDKKQTGWKKTMAELVVPDKAESENGDVKIINESSGLEAYVIVMGSVDGEEYKRLTFVPTTADEQLDKLKAVAKSGTTKFKFYKLVPDVRAEKAAQEKSDSKENTVSKNKTEKTAKKVSVNKTAKKAGTGGWPARVPNVWFFGKIGQKAEGPFKSTGAAIEAGKKTFKASAKDLAWALEDRIRHAYIGKGAYLLPRRKEGEFVLYAKGAGKAILDEYLSKQGTRADKKPVKKSASVNKSVSKKPGKNVATAVADDDE